MIFFIFGLVNVVFPVAPWAKPNAAPWRTLEVELEIYQSNLVVPVFFTEGFYTSQVVQHFFQE